jgi:hypothetical protein
MAEGQHWYEAETSTVQLLDSESCQPTPSTSSLTLVGALTLPKAEEAVSDDW